MPLCHDAGMVRVCFTRHLVRFFPALPAAEGLTVEAATVAEAVAAVDAAFPGLAGYLVDGAGRLRRHVNIFHNGHQLVDRLGLSDALAPGDELLVVQSLSGG